MARIVLIFLGLIFLLAIVGIIGSEWYTSQPDFCGSCHIMKKPYDSWAKSKHNDVPCVDCHYAPGEKITPHSKFKGLGQLFTYLATKDATVQKKAKIPDASCLTSECHPKEKFLDKKVKFTEQIPYIHKTHIDKKIEGQELHCDTCHLHVRPGKHFQVPKVACFLCHFKNTEFNKDRSKCSLCHEIPTKPLQKQKKEGAKPEEKPVTHQSLEEAKVPCQRCHYELIRGKGSIKTEDCFNCHDYSQEMLEKSKNKKLIHTEHVAAQNANCFDCHSPIEHRETDFLDPARLSCEACHPDHHIYQRILLIGDQMKGIPKTPGLMFDVKTTCLGCHTDERIIKGERVAHGTGKTCAACHTEKHEGMAKEWKDKTKEELEYAKEIEKEALDTIKNAKGSVSEKKLKEAMAMLKEGQDSMHIVEYGGGVHNKKYSVMLLDNAMNNFEDAIDLLNE
jgi:nitrate/TMAO reductase-like tetraheme cytochrome c subunit